MAGRRALLVEQLDDPASNDRLPTFDELSPGSGWFAMRAFLNDGLDRVGTTGLWPLDFSGCTGILPSDVYDIETGGMGGNGGAYHKGGAEGRKSWVRFWGNGCLQTTSQTYPCSPIVSPGVTYSCQSLPGHAICSDAKQEIEIPLPAALSDDGLRGWEVDVALSTKQLAGSGAPSSPCCHDSLAF